MIGPEEQIPMIQRAMDSAVLGIFSILYSCAVFLLKFRTKKPQPQTHVTESR